MKEFFISTLLYFSYLPKFRLCPNGQWQNTANYLFRFGFFSTSVVG